MRSLLLFLLTPVLLLQAALGLKLPHFFTDGMVMQREVEAPIWGWAKPGQKIKATLQGQSHETVVKPNHSWKVVFKGLKATAEPQELVIVCDGNQHKISDVLIGEVWIASGQSNMEWQMHRTDHGSAEVAKADDPALRVFTSENRAQAAPANDWWGAWRCTNPKKTGNFTAVGYYFAKDLRKELGVPVAIIECAWGGKPVQAFISDEAIRALPEASKLVAKKADYIKKWDPNQAEKQFKERKAAFDKKLAQWHKDKKGNKPRGPKRPIDPRQNPSLHSTIYNGMIAPLVGYGCRGIIWYQGESNANPESADIYAKLLATMVKDWRTRWGKELPFYFAQLTNYYKPVDKPGTDHHWVHVQEQQRLAHFMIPNSGIAIINDIGASDDIHPRNKLDVGKRLARWALKKTYGRDLGVVSGPLFKALERRGSELAVHFHYDYGLKTKDGKEPRHFEIAAENGPWHWAKARLENNTVVLSHPEIKKPTRVRYAWATNPASANIVNAASLPASVFHEKAELQK